MQEQLHKLDEIISSSSYSEDLPLALPQTHVSIARWFESIVKKGKLEPRMCTVFGEDLLYLFYGGVFYRTGNQPTKNPRELPIAFLFGPTTLSSVIRYYPFDTGAVAKGLFGEWGNRLEPFKEQFKVSGGDYIVPCKIVFHLYGTNRKYLRGKLNPECKNQSQPLPLLYEFMSNDFTSLGVDHRQLSIECQANTALKLDQQLLWIGFPASMMPIFHKLLSKMRPYIPEYDTYETPVIFTPGHIEAKLELAASKTISRYEELPRVNDD